MSFTYMTDYIRGNITQICNLTGQITCNIIKISNMIYYLTDKSSSICFAQVRDMTSSTLFSVGIRL